MNVLILSIGGFIFLLAILVFIRVKSGNKIDVKNSDIVLALIPVVLWLFLTGKIQEFTFGDLRIVAAIKEASTSPVSAQVTELPIETVSKELKGGVGLIPRLIRNEIQALNFRLGYGGYYGPAIAEYLQVLTQYPYLKYVIIEDQQDRFFGMMDAQYLAELFRDPDSHINTDDFARWLNTADVEKIQSIPGFIPRELALQKMSDKKEALRMMNSHDLQILPVVDEQEKFVGIVNRSKLTASMLIDIADKVQ